MYSYRQDKTDSRARDVMRMLEIIATVYEVKQALAKGSAWIITKDGNNLAVCDSWPEAYATTIALHQKGLLK